MITIFIYFKLQYTKLIVELYTIAVTNATQAAAKRTPPPPPRKKGGLQRDLPLRYRCSTLPTELSSQLGARHYVNYQCATRGSEVIKVKYDMCIMISNVNH